jgi:hypothetical protein
MDDPRDSPVFAYQPPMELATLIGRGNKARVETYASIEQCRQLRQELRYHLAYVMRGVRKLRSDQKCARFPADLLGRTPARDA